MDFKEEKKNATANADMKVAAENYADVPGGAFIVRGTIEGSRFSVPYSSSRFSTHKEAQKCADGLAEVVRNVRIEVTD